MAHSDTSSYYQALQHPSQNRQGDILIAATDSFVKTPRPSEKEHALYGELFYSLIPSTNTSAKRLIAATLANSTYAPRLSIFYLALADISIAAPVLAFSPIFSSQDIEELIAKTTPLHHRIIATRTDLNSDNINSLVNTGDKIVALRLLNNQAITLAKEQNNLLHAISQSQTTNTAQATAKPSQQAINELLSLANKGGRLNSSLQQPIIKPTTPKADLPKVDLMDRAKMEAFHFEMMEAVESKDTIRIEETLHSHLDLPTTECKKILNDSTGDTYAIVTKATGLDPLFALFSAKQIFAELNQSPTKAKRFNKVFTLLDRDVCIKGLQQWQNAKLKPAAKHVPQLQQDKQTPRLRVRFEGRTSQRIERPGIADAPRMPNKQNYLNSRSA